MDRVSIPHTEDERGGKAIQPSPAWWWAEGLNDEPVVWMRCACGQIMGIGQHTIEANGDVNPSLHHDVPECGWHVFGRLAGYEGKHGEAD